MKPLQLWLLAYLLNALWQAPLVATAAWLAARAVRRVSAALEHRIWVAALLLEVLFPACSLRLGPLWQMILRATGSATPSVNIRVTLGPAAAVEQGVRHLPGSLLAAITAAYIAATLFAAARLAYGLWKTAAIRRGATPIVLTGHPAQTWQRCSHLFHVEDAQAATYAEINGPVTIGIRRRTLLLPTGWLELLPAEDLDAALAHEFAHMRRRDFARNLAYEILSLPLAWHPSSWLTRTRLTETREILCDALAADAVAGRENYARSLLRLASLVTTQASSCNLHAIGIFDANIFERRVMNLTRKPLELRGLRRIATTSVLTLLAVGTCASALALRIEIPQQQEAPPPTPTPASASTQQKYDPFARYPDAHKVPGSVMVPNLISQVTPVYPPIARAAKVTGTVVLHAIIGKDGAPKVLQAISGPEMLRGAALDAVRQWRFAPYLLNGNPTEVETTVTVDFQQF